MGKLLVFHGEPQRCTGGIQCLPRVQGCREGSSALSGQQCMKVSDDYACTVAGGLGGQFLVAGVCLVMQQGRRNRASISFTHSLGQAAWISLAVCGCVLFFWLSGLVGRQCPRTGHWLHFLPCA